MKRTWRVALAVLAASCVAFAGAPSAGAQGPGEGAVADSAKRKKCKKGYKLVTRRKRRNGRLVRTKACVKKKRGTSRPGQPPAPGPTPGGGGPAPGGGSQGPFASPDRELSGNEAYNHISRYFLDSRFTDCPGQGWPACAGALEERYNHCPDGAWEYHRYTASPGSDINSYGSYQVSGANAHPDGSWDISLVVTAYDVQSSYLWNVKADGSVTGTYQSSSGEVQQLGPMAWQQPAGCGQ